jgi:hypothetical protein
MAGPTVFPTEIAKKNLFTGTREQARSISGTFRRAELN